MLEDYVLSMIGSTLVQALPSLLKLAQALTGGGILRRRQHGQPLSYIILAPQYVIMPHHHNKDS